MLTQNSSNRIHILPEHIIDQIKAGEVIERPSTLLKELLENSIDAGSSKIDIEIINNGMDLIVVKDNGLGMPKEDMELAFLRHATSKIEKFEDIYNLHSYGFRGEALASMASISKITCVSNQKNMPETTLKINGSRVESNFTEKSSQKESKTEIYIKDLFYNTPARMKFIKSQTAEKNQLKKIINAFLLSHPQITFTIKWEDKSKKLFKSTNHIERIQEVTQKSFEKLNYKEIESSYDGITIQAFIGLESSRGSQGKTHYILINNRMVQNIQIHKIITNTASKFWNEGEIGNYILFVNLPSDQLDVNVHPNKTVIKFFETYKVNSLISSTIKNFISKEHLLPAHQEVQSGFSLSDEQTNLQEKNLNYNTSNLENQGEIDSYFKKLDDSNVKSSSQQHSRDLSEAWNCLKFFQRRSLWLFDNDIWILNHTDLVYFSINECIDKNIELSVIPLLISQPIKVTKVNKTILKTLVRLGFEIDTLEQENYILRAFPESFKHINVNKFIEYSLSSKGKEFKDILKAIALKDDLVDRSFYSRSLNQISISKLISHSIIKKVTEDELLKL